MQHLRLAFVNERLLAEEEAKLEMLRSYYRAPVEGWRSILFQAADILDHLGWCRTTLERGERHCAVGAIIAAYNEGDVPSEFFARSAIAREPVLRMIIGKVERQLNRPDVMRWNDTRARSGKEVAELLRAAARN
jgi:hypothetical protein